jgi:tetratricopeptide (TPR) repeat protein
MNPTDDYAALYDSAVSKLEQAMGEPAPEAKIKLYNEVIALCRQSLSSSPDNEVEIRSHALIGQIYHQLTINLEDLDQIAQSGIESLEYANDSVKEKKTAIDLDIMYGTKIFADPNAHFDFFPGLDALMQGQSIFVKKQKGEDNFHQFLLAESELLFNAYGFCLPNLSYSLGRIYFRKGDKPQAKIWFDRCVASIELLRDIPQSFLGLYQNTKASAMNLLDEISPKEPVIQKKGCFIVTAVYGGVCTPQVHTFKLLRDKVLSRNRFGLKFIEFYYLYSPAFSIWLDRKPAIKFLVRTLILDPLYALLKLVLCRHHP